VNTGRTDSQQTLAQRPEEDEYPGRLFPTKAIRIVSLAPDLGNGEYDHSDEQLPAFPPNFSPHSEPEPSHNALLQYLALLEEEPSDGDEELEIPDVDEEEDEWVDEDDSD
jgi:hypothetical protein